MATSFPAAIDRFLNPVQGQKLGQTVVLHSTQHGNINDAINVIEAKLGVDFSNVNTSIDYIVSMILMTQNVHARGGYREVEMDIGVPVLPKSIVWYVNSSKTIKLVEKTYNYDGTIRVLPSSIDLKLYDGTTDQILKRTVSDAIVYDRVFEVSRTRTVT